jgi:restriction endonuclease S subunit
VIDKKQIAVASATGPGVPDGWREVRFDEIAQLVNDRVDNPAEAGVERYVGLEHLDPESLRIRRWGAPTDVEAQKLRFQPGDIIFGKRRAYQRKVAVADFEGICSAHAMVLRAREENVVKEFLPFFMQSDRFFDCALSISVGSLSPTINWKTLAVQKFALPPKDEQQRIADVLWAADVVIESIDNVLNGIAEVMSAFKRQLLSSKHEKVPVGQVSKFTSGKSIKVSELSDYSSETPIPVFGGNGIAGYTDKILPGIADQVVVVGRVGQYCGVVALSTEPCWITDNALFSINISSTVDVEYLGLCLDAIGLNKQKIGNYLPLVNQSVVHNAVIPLPDLAVQRDYVLRATTIKATQQSTMEHLITVRKMFQELRATLLHSR